MGRAEVLLWGAVAHIQSSHEGLVIRERGAMVEVLAFSGFESLTGDGELRSRLGKVRAERSLYWNPSPRGSPPSIPFSSNQ
jgi:hypothetical protein